MIEKVQQFLKEKENLKKELREWVKDTSIPLEVRWKAFVDSQLGIQKDYYWNFKSFERDRDDFHADRDKYRVFNVEDVIDYYERQEDSSTDEEINEFKEEALENFIYSWEFDW